ncbi:rhodanese-like domain-containing protein [Phosphitispora fastidiosa]|uniref:rhodanese-like domain-containing protein n=1 Tax=Phosphitispora fastidiosa TaxID=2837202 RepID=UPI001E37E1C3|nr:rhodanese-like domain-containing protein [Phosphitispora fastidiosa]MBU7008597.1 rhodanese-related sulfurtransferase [Phosphitispora fastidiosa]
MFNREKPLWLFVIITLTLVMMGSLAGCGGDDDELVLRYIADELDSAKTAAPENGEKSGSGAAAQIIEATNSYLNTGKAPTISVEDVYNNVIIGKDPSYQILSIRKPEDYARGHLQGAINVQFGQIYKQENLDKLDKNKKIIVVCYTGHTASYAAMFLNQLGYEAYAMKFGMMGWTSDSDVLALTPFTKAADYPVETKVNTAEPTHDLPAISTGAKDAAGIVAARTGEYLTSGRAPTTSVEDVYNNAVVNKDSDYFILSIRRPEDYAKGHIPGAVNIPFAQLAKEENLKKLPPDKKIIVVCYTGHTASYAAMFLNQLGYEAYAMKFSMMGWTSDSDVLALVPFTGAPGYPTVSGPNP